MAKHAHTIPTSRRSLLSAAPAVVVLAGAGIGGAVQAAVPCADAELHVLCATFHQQYAEAHDEANLAWETANGASFDTFNELNDLTPATEAGHRAKARVAVVMLAMFNEGDGYGGGDPQAMFALNLLRDWLGEA